MHAIIGALAGSADEILQALLVERVEQAPHSCRLRVVVSLPPEMIVGTDAVCDHLHRAMGWLRSGVAASIHRRYTPELVFEVNA